MARQPHDAYIPKQLQQFIAKHIDSIEGLEVLLFLFRNRQKDWSADEVASALYSSTSSIDVRLDGFQKHGFVRLLAPIRRFQYATHSHKLDTNVAKLNDLYPAYRLRIIDLIYGGKRTGVELLAEAFRFKKDDDDG